MEGLFDGHFGDESDVVTEGSVSAKTIERLEQGPLDLLRRQKRFFLQEGLQPPVAERLVARVHRFRHSVRVSVDPLLVNGLSHGVRDSSTILDDFAGRRFNHRSTDTIGHYGRISPKERSARSGGVVFGTNGETLHFGVVGEAAGTAQDFRTPAISRRRS